MSEFFTSKEPKRKIVASVAALSAFVLAGCSSNESNPDAQDTASVTTYSPNTEEPLLPSDECNFNTDSKPNQISKGEAIAIAPSFVQIESGEVVLRPVLGRGEDEGSLYEVKVGDSGSPTLRKIGTTATLSLLPIPGALDISREERKQFDGCSTSVKDEELMPEKSQAVTYEGQAVGFENKKFPTFLGKSGISHNWESLRDMGAFGARIKSL